MKKGSFQHTKFKTRKNTRKDLKKECDQLVSEIVKLRDGGKCQKCGHAGTQSHHLFSRRYLNTRWDSRNMVYLCYPCHLHGAHSKQEEFRDWILREIGPELFEKLKISAYMTGSKMDMAAVKLMLEVEVEKEKALKDFRA